MQSNKKIPVGNAGFVRLVDFMGSDLSVVNAARVSFNKESSWEYGDMGSMHLCDKDVRLINYLAKHNHWTPFAHTSLTFHIKAPMPIRTQFFKHKVGFVENEVSRRYVDDQPEFFIPEWSYRPEGSVKQGSGGYVTTEDYNTAWAVYQDAITVANNAYNSLIKLGIAPEQARFVLPQSTYTEWYWTGSLSALARFYSQRVSKHAQKEIRVYAEVIDALIPSLMKHSWCALTMKNWLDSQ
jgi:thymidylate synthase (FAD)